jgi:hypothetical protein
MSITLNPAQFLVLKHFICYIGQKEFLDIINQTQPELVYTDEKFDNGILEFIKNILRPINENIMRKNYVEGLLNDSLNINLGNINPFETQQSIYKDIINKQLS